MNITLLYTVIQMNPSMEVDGKRKILIQHSTRIIHILLFMWIFHNYRIQNDVNDVIRFKCIKKERHLSYYYESRV
jgi:hypothetical protein